MQILFIRISKIDESLGLKRIYVDFSQMSHEISCCMEGIYGHFLIGET